MAGEMRNYIAGQWVDGATTIEDRNPSDISDLIGHFAQATAAQLDDAVAAAALAQPLWWAAGIQKRHDVLMAIGTELMGALARNRPPAGPRRRQDAGRSQG
jgi:acyl-CoA reductase-like NAD-dependent aldehyde dehydrogenase